MIEELPVFLIMGIFFGALYDFFRFFRLLFSNKRADFFFDFLFFFIISPVIFIFLLSYNNGQVRVLYFTAILLGFILYILTVFRLTGYIAKPVTSFFRRFMKKRLNNFKKVLQSITKVYYNVSVLSKKPLLFLKRKKKKTGDSNGNDFQEFETE